MISSLVADAISGVIALGLAVKIFGYIKNARKKFDAEGLKPRTI